MKLIRVNTFQQTFNTNLELQYAFNQIEFLNYDPFNPVRINNDIILQPAIVVAGKPYPTFQTIALNIGEVASDRVVFALDFAGSTTAKLLVIWTEYVEQPL